MNQRWTSPSQNAQVQQALDHTHFTLGRELARRVRLERKLEENGIAPPPSVSPPGTRSPKARDRTSVASGDGTQPLLHEESSVRCCSVSLSSDRARYDSGCSQGLQNATDGAWPIRSVEWNLCKVNTSCCRKLLVIFVVKNMTRS